jgi:hypothetical protein
MEEELLNAVAGLIEGRNTFFERTMNRLSATTRDTILSSFLLNERCFMEMINRIHNSHQRTTAAAAALLTLNLPQNFMEPVTVAPTQTQIDRATTTITDVPENTRCAICQDDIAASATQIRSCGHMYHSVCFTQWFSMSVRCPVCRHDIRQTTPSGGT